MLHRVKEKKLGRDAAHRKALIKNLSSSLILNKQLETTLAKAKYVKPYVEKLVTRAKQGKDFNSVKFAQTKLTTEAAVKALFSDIAPLYEKRPGGYTRITKLPERDGDKAKMARLEFIIEKKAKAPKKEEKVAEAKIETKAEAAEQPKEEKAKETKKPAKRVKKSSKAEEK